MEQKRFPADTTLDVSTFLNDKKINGELYAILQGASDYMVIDKVLNLYQTYVPKSKMPTQAAMCKMLGIKSPKTLRQHMQYLIDQHYIVPGGTGEDDKDVAYYLPEMEDIYFLIPLDTLKYLNNNCREHVIKIYIYLGQRYKMALALGKQYEFTLEELGTHIGIGIKNHVKQYEVVNNALELLYNSGLITYVSFFNGQTQKKKLTSFSFTYTKPEASVSEANQRNG